MGANFPRKRQATTPPNPQPPDLGRRQPQPRPRPSRLPLPAAMASTCPCSSSSSPVLQVKTVKSVSSSYSDLPGRMGRPATHHRSMTPQPARQDEEDEEAWLKPFNGRDLRPIPGPVYLNL